MLTSGLPEAERRRVLAGVTDGTVDIVVGTHALISDGVKFKSLAVAVIDEQHRFGVHQRLALRDKAADGATPHTIVMTATPIPRTLAMTLFGDLDVSTIRELPPGRKPITTRVVGHQMSDEVWAFALKRLDRGEQAYVVVPAIENAEDLFEDPAQAGAPKLASVHETLSQLEAGPLKGKRLAAMHGRLSRETRDSIMGRFREGQIDVLVATTVIEVGVDVPNATVMVILDADRYGLAQLHQLRGRVGRGSKTSACILVGLGLGELAAARLAVMANVSDGFTLAEKDLEIRGFGELIGTRQAGMPPFRVVDFSKDLELLQQARRDAAAWIEASPKLARPGDALLKRRLLKAHGQWMGLADVG
ncbi:MAG: helicase-related protein [Phycisphaerales bacterium]